MNQRKINGTLRSTHWKHISKFCIKFVTTFIIFNLILSFLLTSGPTEDRKICETSIDHLRTFEIFHYSSLLTLVWVKQIYQIRIDLPVWKFHGCTKYCHILEEVKFVGYWPWQWATCVVLPSGSCTICIAHKSQCLKNGWPIARWAHKI